MNDKGIKYPVVHFYSSLLHIAKVSDLSVRMKIAKSEVIRQAIDLLYDLVNAEETLEQSKSEVAHD